MGKLMLKLNLFSCLGAVSFINVRIPIPETDFTGPAEAELPVSADLTMH